MAQVTTVEWQTVVVLRILPESAATALMQVPSSEAIGKIVQTVRRADITAIKNARGAKVLAIFSCAREKNRLSFNPNCDCQFPMKVYTSVRCFCINTDIRSARFKKQISRRKLAVVLMSTRLLNLSQKILLSPGRAIDGFTQLFRCVRLMRVERSMPDLFGQASTRIRHTSSRRFLRTVPDECFRMRIPLRELQITYLPSHVWFSLLGLR